MLILKCQKPLLIFLVLVIDIILTGLDDVFKVYTGKLLWSENSKSAIYEEYNAVQSESWVLLFLMYSKARNMYHFTEENSTLSIKKDILLSLISELIYSACNIQPILQKLIYLYISVVITG
jgi:hypothetical protein